MVYPAGVFPFDICDQLAMYVEVDTAYQSPSGKSVGEIRVVLQFTPTVVQAAPGPGTVYSATYGQPYSAPPACEGSAPRAALSHVLFEVDCICFAAPAVYPPQGQAPPFGAPPAQGVPPPQPGNGGKSLYSAACTL